MKILINGRAASGKDAISDYLVEKYGFEKVSFATPIYTIARDLFNMKEKDRTLLIAIGDRMRQIDEDVFIKWALRQLDPNKNYVISDCRQLNEYKLCTLEGFIPVRVKSNLDTRIQRAIQRDGMYPNIEEWEGHSETGADNCEYLYEIENNTDLENLHKQIDKLLELNKFKPTKPTTSNLIYSQNCHICNNEMMRLKSIIANPFDKTQKVVATYYECFKCGEIIFSAEESKRLEELGKIN